MITSRSTYCRIRTYSLPDSETTILRKEIARLHREFSKAEIRNMELEARPRILREPVQPTLARLHTVKAEAEGRIRLG